VPPAVDADATLLAALPAAVLLAAAPDWRSSWISDDMKL
jgi:hypothetical protein